MANNPFNLTDLINVLSIQTTSYQTERMEKFLMRRLSKMTNVTIDKDSYGNIYATKTPTSNVSPYYPTIVSHIDTVHDINMDSIVRRHNDILYSIDSKNYQRTGIGGDDKVGVYIALACLDNLPQCKAVFFKDEEVGCVGSSKADHTFFDDSTIVLECDRKGMGDFVTSISGTDLCDELLLDDIVDVLKLYGRVQCTGGLTDVLEIAYSNDVQVANVNCGYYNPHTDDEIVSISDVELTLLFVLDVFDMTSHKRYTMKRVPKTYGYGRHTKWDYDDWYGFYDEQQPDSKKNVEPEHITVCHSGCGNDQIVYDPYSDGYYCYNCNEYTFNSNHYA